MFAAAGSLIGGSHGSPAPLPSLADRSFSRWRISAVRPLFLFLPRGAPRRRVDAQGEGGRGCRCRPIEFVSRQSQALTNSVPYSSFFFLFSLCLSCVLPPASYDATPFLLSFFPFFHLRSAAPSRSPRSTKFRRARADPMARADFFFQHGRPSRKLPCNMKNALKRNPRPAFLAVKSCKISQTSQ